MSDKYCILQDDLKDCGVCCLLSIIKYYHGNVSREYLKELTKTDKNGVNALNLLRAAREIGFEAYGMKGKIKDLQGITLPLIAHIMIDKKYGHFIVIYKIDIKKDKIIAMDPARGFITLSQKDLNKLSTNYFLILKPKQMIPKLVENNHFKEKLISLFIKHKMVILSIIIMSILYTIFNIVESYQFKLLFDELEITLNSDLKKIFFFLVVLLTFNNLVNFFRSRLITGVNFILDKSLVEDAYHHIIHLPYLYYKNHTNGDLVTRINDLGNIKELISNFFVSLFVDFALALLVLIIMFKINILLTIITIVGLLLYSLVTFIANYDIKDKIKENYQRSSIVNNFLIESMSSFETIKNLSLQNYICNKFNEHYSEYNLVKESLLKKIQNESFYKNCIISILNLLIMYFGIKDNSLSITSLVTFITLSNYLIQPVKNILDLELIYQNTKESIRRMKEIYNIPKEDNLYNKNKSINNLQGRIDISDVSYSYNGIDNVLKNVNIEINEGEKVLIYGNSGCGKSTLMELLIKYLDNNYEGDITIGGFDLKKININTLRENICYVSQNEYLYTNSIYENITLGKKIKYESFLDITKNLFIDEIVKNSSLNYDYLIESNGDNLSGGERARIILARALLKKANIYIFDETFSNIDIKKERKILEYIFSKFQNKTFIIISHRASNLDLFNKQILMGEELHEAKCF